MFARYPQDSGFRALKACRTSKLRLLMSTQ